MNYTSADSMEMDEAPTQDIEQSPDIELQNANLADGMDEDKLLEISNECRSGFENDLSSREEWEQSLDDWIKLAQQHRDVKSFPWKDASNVKYPLLTTAAMQFAARAYPSLVPSNGQVVKSKVIGKDPTGQKYERSERVSKFMSWQVMYDIPNWEEDMDRMLMQLPVVGTMFKKTWFDVSQDKIISKLILPKNIIVNNWTTSLEDAERISEIITISPRVLKERQNQTLYRDVDLGPAQGPDDKDNHSSALNDETTPYELIEQHTFLDLDDDDYREPYIVLFERTTGEILRISRRYELDDVEEEDGKIIKIKPLQVYTKFGFVPNPDGSFYDIGFGVLLGPLNESVNTLINQLIDSGSLANLQSGFISKSLRMKMGDTKFAPGEWKPVNATGDDLRKQLVQLPTKDPSNVLFQLMGSLITSGKELASVAEIFVGKMPGQNTPATTTMASIEQGMKVFTAVYKRLYRSLEQEFKKIYKLNKLYIDPHTVVNILDEDIGPDDFDDESYDVCPGADPTAVSQTEKLLKAQGLMELVGQIPQMFDLIEVVSRVLEAQEQPNWQKVFSQEVQASGQLPPAPPDPKLMAIEAKVKADQQKAAVDIQSKVMDMELKGRDHTMQMQMKQQEHAQKMQQTVQSAQIKGASEIAMARVYSATEKAKGQQQLQQGEQAHKQKMQQTKETQTLTKHSGSGAGSKQPKSGSKPSRKPAKS